MVARTKKPALSRLKGSLKLDPLKRIRYKVDDSLLLDEYKDWNDYKKLVGSYFKNVSENWEESAEEFIVTLLNTLERLIDRRGTHVGADKLFTDYCKRLYEYYNSQSIKNQVMKYYRSKELTIRMHWREREAFNQARTTSLALVKEQGMVLEDEAATRMNGKRKENEDIGESPCQKARYSDDAQSEQHEGEVSELEEYNSFITDTSDEAYKTEDSIHYGDNLKIRTYMLTMYEMNPYEKYSKAYVYDDNSTFDERLSISHISLNTDLKPNFNLLPILLNDEEYSQIRQWRMCVKKKDHYFPPQATTVNQLNLNHFLYYANETILNDYDHSAIDDKSEMGAIIDAISPIFRYLFPAKGSINCKWDKSSFVPKTQSSKKLRLDFILYANNQEIGCGEVKNWGVSDDLLNNDRGRIAETMKRQLHSRILKSKDQKEHVTFGIFCYGCDIELYLMAFDDKAENSYQLYELIKLKTPTSPITYTSMEETLEYLISFKDMIDSTLATYDDIKKPCIYFNYTSLFKPTLSFKKYE